MTRIISLTFGTLGEMMRKAVYPRIRGATAMLAIRFLTLALVTFALVLASNTEGSASRLYKGSWIAESFGNDKVGIGSDASLYFQFYAIPHGLHCNGLNPRCHFDSTPTDTGGNFNPLGPNCRALTAGEMPRPAKGGTTPPRVPPLFRNKANFSAGGSPLLTSCYGSATVSGSYATTYLGPGDPLRGVVQKGAPVEGSGLATTTAPDPFAFKIPQAGAIPAPGAGMFRTITGSFPNVPPYLYSYTYANFKNDAGDFGPGEGFFSLAATPATLNFKNKVGGTTVASVTVKRGANRFGGVMKLLGSYTTKVCYFYAGGCGLGYGTWAYEHIGASGYKDSKVGSPVVTASYTTNFSFTYYNTALGTIAKYDIVAQRFPWTTGSVTLNATARGEHKTFHQRKGFDNRVSGVGTVQLVSPILTQWLAQAANAPQFETGGIAVMQIRFVPEPGVLFGLVAGLSLLTVLYRFRS